MDSLVETLQRINRLITAGQPSSFKPTQSISRDDFLVKSKNQTERERRLYESTMPKADIDLTGYQRSGKLKATAVNGRLVIGDEEHIKQMTKWIDYKKQKETAEAERKRNNEKVLKSYGLKKDNSNVKIFRNPAMALVINLEAYRKEKSETKS